MQLRSEGSKYRGPQNQAGDHLADHHRLAEETQNEAEDPRASEDDNQLQKQG
jgi:hypothetical protein